jgi:hypothetical protein
MSIEAMRQALEALEMGLGQVSGDYNTAIQKAIGAVTTLRTAIEQAEKQEPVAWMYVNTDGECEQIEYGLCDFDDPSIQLLYTAPRQWVGLTDEELADWEDWEAIAADQAMTIAMMESEQEKAQEDNEQLIYDAWLDSEAYGVPMTEEGGRLAEIRLRTFRLGWEYHRFYLKHGDVYMKDYLERQDYDE